MKGILTAATNSIKSKSLQLIYIIMISGFTIIWFTIHSYYETGDHMIFSDYYLFSDIDGTLGTENEGIPLRNIAAILRFVENGGIFSLCTGRMAINIKPFTKGIAVNGTCITDNGAAYYDYPTGKRFGVRILPKQSVEYLRFLLNNEEFFDVTAVTNSGFFRVMNYERLDMPNDEDLDCRLKKLSEIHTPQLRIVFTLPPGSTIKDKVSKWNALDFPGVSFIQSSDSYIEMMPKDANKGKALLELCEMQGVPVDRTFFIGDSYNDMEIFKTAGFSACVAETPLELQGLCDCVLGPCMEAALAEYIKLIETKGFRVA